MDRLPKLDNTSKNNGGLFQKKNWNNRERKVSMQEKKKQGMRGRMGWFGQAASRLLESPRFHIKRYSASERLLVQHALHMHAGGRTLL